MPACRTSIVNTAIKVGLYTLTYRSLELTNMHSLPGCDGAGLLDRHGMGQRSILSRIHGWNSQVGGRSRRLEATRKVVMARARSRLCAMAALPATGNFDTAGRVPLRTSLVRPDFVNTACS